MSTGEHVETKCNVTTEQRFLCKGVKWIVEDEMVDDVGYACPGCPDCREDDNARLLNIIGHGIALLETGHVAEALNVLKLREDCANMHSDEWWQSELDRCVRVEGDKYRALFVEVARISVERDLLRDALEMLYDKWENGDTCWEDGDNSGCSLGQAVQLSCEEEKEILALIKDFKTPQGEPALIPPGTREPVVTAPQGNAGESPAISPNHQRLCPAEWLLTTNVTIRCTLEAGHEGKHRAPEPFYPEDMVRPWRGVVAHDPVECAVCDVELRGIERAKETSIKLPLPPGVVIQREEGEQLTAAAEAMIGSAKYHEVTDASGVIRGGMVKGPRK